MYYWTDDIQYQKIAPCVPGLHRSIERGNRASLHKPCVDSPIGLLNMASGRAWTGVQEAMDANNTSSP
jgi:hypothetical protein